MRLLLDTCALLWLVADRACEVPIAHGDPADRMIVATALLEGLPVVTSDSESEQRCIRPRLPCELASCAVVAKVGELKRDKST